MFWGYFDFNEKVLAGSSIGGGLVLLLLMGLGFGLLVGVVFGVGSVFFIFFCFIVIELEYIVEVCVVENLFWFRFYDINGF